ncbi:hypothetical protein B0T21DRAFT_348856 [Apiosordaria backusii]|uniref:Uncharacterized protein n=1 Tax=Apiosordaria backusii TaxID=314023 RepID=A0AA40BJG4_9PEZI|nr:hypothetical protein B0T21DRAFT_348856 [Apiosordaria backusii]
MPQPALKCAYAPGPNTCVQCLESFRDAQSVASCIEELFSGESIVCTREYPRPSELNIGDGQSCTTDACFYSGQGYEPHLIGEFIKALRSKMESDQLTATAFDTLVHNRQMEAAMKYPYPNDGSKKSIAAWERRQELRLLPQDDGYICWRAGKHMFRESIRKFIGRPEMESHAVLNLNHHSSADTHEERVEKFLEAYFPAI